jgi:hypothetical protein
LTHLDEIPLLKRSTSDHGEATERTPVLRGPTTYGPQRLGGNGLFAFCNRAILAAVENTGTLRGLLIGVAMFLAAMILTFCVADALEARNRTQEGERSEMTRASELQRPAAERRDPSFVDR